MNFEQFNARINELWAATKVGKLPRNERFAAIERLTDEYITTTGRRPDPAHLDRLATLCLYEEITDPHPDKMALEEDAVMSDRQYGRRKKSEIWREEVHVGPAHVTGKRSVAYTDDDGGMQSGKNTYYLR